MYISSNYLFVSGEHRVHYNINVCSRFCCTPRPFQAYGYPLLLLYLGGLVFILVFRQECVPNAAVYSKLLVLWHNSIGSSFSPHTRHYILFSDFSLSPVFAAEDFKIAALLRDRLLARSLLRLLIIIRPDTPIFLTGEQLECFSGPFVPCFFIGFSWQIDSAPSILLSDAAASAMIPTGQAEKTLPRKRKSDFLSLVLPLMYPSSH